MIQASIKLYELSLTDVSRNNQSFRFAFEHELNTDGAILVLQLQSVEANIQTPTYLVCFIEHIW